MKVKLFYTLGFFLLSGFLFISGETVTRLFFTGIVNYPPNGKVIDPYKANPYLIKSKQFIHSHYPNVEYTQSRANYSVSYKINSHGFRESEYSLEPQKKRILVVGDSVVEGHGVEYSDTFTYQLKKEFEKQNLEVLNMGIQGSSLLVHSVNLPRFFNLKPEAIVICLNENDWIDDRIHEIEHKKLPILERPSYFDKSYSGFLFKFRFVQFVYYQYYTLFHSKTNTEKIIHSNLNKLPTLISGQTELDTFSEKRLLPKESARSNFELSKEYINLIISECQKRNIKVFFINLTYLVYSPRSSLRTNKEFIFDSNELLESYLQEKKIPYLNASGVVQDFYKQNPNGSFFIVDDEHPTKQAHTLFAEEIKRWLENKM